MQTLLARPPRPQNKRLRILWVDDKIKEIQDLTKAIEKHDASVDFITAASASETIRLLNRDESVAAIILDLRLDEDDPGHDDGAHLLLEINRIRPGLPVVLYSGYLDDVRYEPALADGIAVAEVNRGDVSWRPPLSECAPVRSAVQFGLAYDSVRTKKPELIGYRDYIRDSERWKEEVNVHWAKHGFWIETQLKRRGWKWGVVCGVKLEAGSNNIDDFPTDEELSKIGIRTNLIPFAYPADAPPEELGHSIWAKVGDSGEDWYPTVRVKVAGQEGVADFDTGAPVSHLPDTLIPRNKLTFARTTVSVHLGEAYSYYAKKLAVQLFSKKGEVRELDLAVFVVENWLKSPFVKVNKGRFALIGRDVLRRTSLMVTLDSARRTSSVEFL